jgi:pimeloyl-ACP methyl ester carboxylesterase
MGGMIAQVLAGRHPDRVASLGLIMSSSGKPLSALPRWRVIKLALTAPAKDAAWEERLASEVRNISIINGPNFLPPADVLRRRVEELRSRSDYPQGMLRQFDAILGTGSLLRFTRSVSAPTVVIHGSDDPMVRPRNGRNLAKAIPGACFVVVDGMGHDLPEPVWRPIVEALTENFALAG